MLKKSIITIFIILLTNTAIYATSVNESLTSIENGIFGYDYRNETDVKRLDRLEEYMYGSKRTGTAQERAESLQNDSGIVVEAQKPKKQNNLQPADSISNHLQKEKEQLQAKQPSLKEDESVEYAIVDKMEKDLYNKTFKGESIYDRIDRLENTVFQNTRTGDLSTRVDNLASVLQPSGRKRAISQTTVYDDVKKLSDNNGFQQIDEQTLPFQLAALEHDILKHEYVGDNNAGRLARLEQNLFKRTFQNDTDVQRLQRILAAYEAKKDSYKYENNRKMQNMATISQIGGILLMILAILL